MEKVRYVLIIIFYFFYTLTNAQNNYSIEGEILNDSLSIIPNANIIVKDKNTSKILSYTSSNSDGYFKLKLTTNNNLVNLTVSSIGYKTLKIDIDLTTQLEIFKKIKLESNTLELNEIVLNAEKKAITISGDTTKYNIESFLNGTEVNLKDLLNNLPGISVNENGKIILNGKQIDELLIDGENLYNKQHQFATENLSSNAVKSIETYKNHSSFDKLRTTNQSGEIALNVLIKDEFKNKFKGTIQADNNFINRYKINSTLYNFSKKNKLSIIKNSNNLGNNPIDIKDYYSLVDGENESNSKSSNVIFSSINDVPKFLTIGENVLKANNNFLTISNVYSPSKKIKINFYTINNFSKIKENLKINQSFTNSGIEFKENLNNNENNTFGLYNLKSVYKEDENTIFKITNSFLIDNLNNNEVIENFSQQNIVNINQNNNAKKNIFQNNFNFSKKIKQNFLKSNVFFDFTELDFENNINSNQPFLNLDFNNSFEFQQFYKKINKKTGYNIDYIFDFKKANINLKTGFQNNLFYFNNQSRSDFDYLNFYKTNNNITFNQITLNYNFTKKLNFSLTVNHNLANQKVNDLEKYTNSFFGHNAIIKYSFKTNTFLQLSKSLSNNLSEPDQLIENYFVKNYRTIFQNFNLKPNSIFPSNKLNLNFFKFNEKTNAVLILNISHIYTNETSGLNYINDSNFNISQYTIIPNERITTAMLFIEKKLKNKPLEININIDYNNTQRAFFINENLSYFVSNYLSSSIFLKSNFKKSPIHFDLGYNYAINLFNNNNIKTQQTTFQPYIGFNGLLYKNFNWKINNVYSSFTADDSSRKILNISPSLGYSKGDFWEYYIIGNNILNLKSPEIISNNSDVGFNMQSITTTLAGFINFGIKYKF